MDGNKEILKIFFGEPSSLIQTQNEPVKLSGEKIFELFVLMLPQLAQAFQNPQTKEVVTLRVFIDEYMYLIKSNRSASYSESVQLSFHHLTAFFDTQRTISSIQLKDIENFLIYLQQKVRKGYVVYFRNLKAAFNKARDWGYVSENFFTKVKLPKRQKMAPVFINSDQLSVICGWIKSETVKDFVMMGFYTGMRLDEIVNLRWKNVDLQNRVITVGDEEFTTKSRNQRFIPICEEALTSILSQRERRKALPIDNTYVFCKNNDERFTADHYSKEFKKACKAAGMDNAIHFHSLRHSFASNLAQKSVSLYTIKELLGHSSISTTEIYSHLNMDSLREAVKMLDVRSETQEVKTAKEPTPFVPLPRKEMNALKIFRINSGEIK
jgi:site-specific recombinase XerD